MHIAFPNIIIIIITNNYKQARKPEDLKDSLETITFKLKY